MEHEIETGAICLFRGRAELPMIRIPRDQEALKPKHLDIVWKGFECLKLTASQVFRMLDL